jgi:toxin ParE1/3/4
MSWQQYGEGSRRCKHHEPLPQEGLDEPFGPPPEEYLYRCPVCGEECWSMRPSLMWRSVQSNSVENILVACPRWGVPDVTARRWSTSRQSPSPPAGRFVHSSEAAFARLAALPSLGPAVPFPSPLAQGMRVWRVEGFERYLIFYRSVAAGVEVVRVLHAARDIPTLFK